MKKYIKTVILFAGFALLTTSSMAYETVYFDTLAYKKSAANNAKVSETLSVDVGGTTTYLWYKMVDGARVDITDVNNLKSLLTSANTDLKFDKSINGPEYGENNKKVDLDIEINVHSIDYKMVYTTLISSNGSKVTTAGDFILDSFEYYYGAGNLKIGGNLKMNYSAMGSPDTRRGIVDSLWVEGVTTIAGGGNNRPSLYVAGVANHSIDNPDAVFKGGITATAIQNTVEKFIYDGSPLTYGLGGDGVYNMNKHSYTWVNGASGTAAFLVKANTSGEAGWTLVFTNNTGDATSKSGFYHENGNAGIDIVMRSATFNDNKEITGYTNFNQYFKGSEMSFIGGVKMISGGLFLNYNAAKGADINHGALSLQKASGAQATTFGNSSDTVGGTFVFSNLVVSDGGGSIRVRMETNSTMDGVVCDTLSFINGATGSGVVLIDMKNSNGNTPDEMIDFMIDNNLSVKVISWSVVAEDGIIFTTTDEYKTYNFNGKDYVFNATNKADGLYINYIAAVPEASTFAAIFGVFALGFAAWRRKK